MTNPNNNSEKTIDNLKNESVRGEEIMGGGVAVGGPMPPIPNGPMDPIPSNPPLNDDGSVINAWNDGVVVPGFNPDGTPILPDQPQPLV